MKQNPANIVKNGVNQCESGFKADGISPKRSASISLHSETESVNRVCLAGTEPLCPSRQKQSVATCRKKYAWIVGQMRKLHTQHAQLYQSAVNVRTLISQALRATKRSEAS